jgi:hypothetical protein
VSRLTELGERMAEAVIEDNLTKKVSEVATKIAATKNPEYQITEVVNLLPFRSAVEMVGETAGRIYLRTRNTLYAVTTSDRALEELRDQINAALEAGPHGR